MKLNPAGVLKFTAQSELQTLIKKPPALLNECGKQILGRLIRSDRKNKNAVGAVRQPPITNSPNSFTAVAQCQVLVKIQIQGFIKDVKPQLITATGIKINLPPLASVGALLAQTYQPSAPRNSAPPWGWKRMGATGDTTSLICRRWPFQPFKMTLS